MILFLCITGDSNNKSGTFYIKLEVVGENSSLLDGSLCLFCLII